MEQFLDCWAWVVLGMLGVFGMGKSLADEDAKGVLLAGVLLTMFFCRFLLAIGAIQ